MSRRVALAVAAAALLGTSACRPGVGGYRSITIDPATLRIDWQNPITTEYDARGLSKPMLGSYYQIFTGGTGGTSVEHYIQSDGKTPRLRYSYLDTGDHVIYKSVNDREILRGPFGTVYSQKTCFYNLPIESYFNDIAVHLYANALGEPATISDEPPADAPAALTNVSVIRVLQGGPQYFVAAAVYAADGRALSLSVEGSKNGDWVTNSVGWSHGTTTFSHPSLTREDVAALASFGLPGTIDVERALTQRPIGLATPSQGHVDRDAINLHYASDRWIRQDEYLAAGGHLTRYLAYVRTPEDAALENACAERFRERVGKQD